MGNEKSPLKGAPGSSQAGLHLHQTAEIWRHVHQNSCFKPYSVVTSTLGFGEGFHQFPRLSQRLGQATDSASLAAAASAITASNGYLPLAACDHIAMENPHVS